MSYSENEMGRVVGIKKFFVVFCTCLCFGLSGAVAHAVDDIAELTRQAEAGDVDAQFNLGVRYDRGEGVPQDAKKAIYYYELAANQGHIAVQVLLGMRYVLGQGVPQDDKKAVYYFELAAKQGDAAAQSKLGALYANGRGVPQDDIKAVYYYELAAKHGNAYAYTNLGAHCAVGRGVVQNLVKAYAYTLVGYALDSSNKDFKEFLEPKLTPSQREQAQALAAKMWEELPK